MKGVVFNIHDIVLLLIAGECGILAVLFLARRGSRPLAHPLLAIFLILNTLIAVDTLMYWGAVVRYQVFQLSPNLFFLFGFAYFLQGPILYWYTRSLIYNDFIFRWSDVLHLLPAVAAQIYLYFVYHRYPAEIQGELVLGLEIFTSTKGYHDIFVMAMKSSAFVYGIACLFQLVRYRANLKQNYSNINQVDFVWLRLLIGGFLLTWMWNLVTHIFGLYHPGAASDMMGITGNYILFALTNVLLFYSLVCLDVPGGIGQNAKQDEKHNHPEHRDPIDLHRIDRILAVTENGKLFLNPRLTLEEFARQVKLPPRQVSSTIKRRFDRNFLEYINSYRVEEAKRSLANPENRNDSVLDIATKSGFNSKATFNRFFKRFAGVTPTEFRRRCLSGESGCESGYEAS